MDNIEKKNNFYIYIFIVIIISFLGLKIVNYITKIGSVEIDGKKFKVEILKHNWELERGLSGREKLKNDTGVLFIFKEESKYPFWMKDMKFPIDIIWINDSKIVYIKHNVPIPITQNIPTFAPDVSARYVLEINAGLSEKYGFQIGDGVELDI